MKNPLKKLFKKGKRKSGQPEDPDVNNGAAAAAASAEDGAVGGKLMDEDSQAPSNEEVERKHVANRIAFDKSNNGNISTANDDFEENTGGACESASGKVVSVGKVLEDVDMNESALVGGGSDKRSMGDGMNESALSKVVSDNLLDDSSLYIDATYIVSELKEANGESSSEKLVETPVHDIQSRLDDIDDTDIQEKFLDKIGLKQYCEEGISLNILRKESSHKLESLTDIPWYFLSKILMLDYRGRDDMISQSLKKVLEADNEVCSNMEFGSELDELLSGLETPQNSLHPVPHPIDVVIAVFKCCSNVVRQILCEKMFACKLSIPLVLPQLHKSKSLFLLWALRGIAIETRQDSGKLSEVSVADHPFPVIACLRLGDISCSKSAFLNEIVNGQSHSTFFHRNCTNGMNYRYFTDGLLEISWRLSLQELERSDDSDKHMAFVNMRGDGKLHDTNRKFLCEISNVVLVFLDLSELEDPSIYITLKSITMHAVQLILLITKQHHLKPDENAKKNIIKCIKEVKCEHFTDKNVILCFDGQREKNLKILKQQTLEKISSCLKINPSKTALDGYKGLARDLQIRIDEDTYSCKESQIVSRRLVDEFCKDGIHNVKIGKLPLQGELWHEWARQNKEQHRRDKKHTDSLDSYLDKIYTAKENQRRKQLNLIENPSNLFDTFLDFIVNFSSEKRMYCLLWLKLYMDNKSKQILPDLREACSLKWNEIRQYANKENIPNLEKELAEMEMELAQSSVGLEHLMREISQAYEAYDYMKGKVSVPDKVLTRVSQLPRIMAELILQGYPMELMDGDAASVPITWIKAVLKQLQKLIGDKKIFVLSVLGIQSSGKSTMLNTMFGLQFEVAAGRCTRGVHAQLMPISKEYLSEKYDYILVVDTEGLRANELAKAKLQHDNEIATLVIGLGDVTLVNIKGENLSEMEDLLQIVIHALLKMKLVNKSLQLQPSCFFIHQNVPAVDASSKLRMGQQVFMETLDKVTKAAAKEEDAPQFTKFKEVIDFDINTNIAYISDLWEGDPPMAPANPGYSKHINRVRHALLSNIMPKRASQLNIEKFSKKISDLWDGILDQNFIFSFKNSLELEAYATLENILSDVLWSLKNAALEWQNATINIITNSETELKESDLKKECCVHLEEQCRSARDKLEAFFRLNEDNVLLEQWRVKTFQKLDNRYEEIFERTMSTVRVELRIREIKNDQQRDMHRYKDDILAEAKQVAETLESNLGENELMERFNKKWEVWINKLPQSYKPDEIDIEDKVYSTLIQKFKADQALVYNGWKQQSGQEISVELLCENIMYALENNIYLGRKWYSLFRRKSKEEVVTEFSLKLANDIKSFADENQHLDFTGTGNHRSVCFQLLKLVNNFTNKMVLSKIQFTNEKEFKIWVVIYGSQYICGQYFKELKRNFGIDGSYQMTKFGIHPYFEDVLYQRFKSDLMIVFHRLQRDHLSIQQSLERFQIDVRKHICINDNIHVDEAVRHAKLLFITLYSDVRAYIERKEIQVFREEYAEKLIKLVEDMILSSVTVRFSKAFKIDMAVHVCYLSIPKLQEKHKRYKNNINPCVVFKRDYYTTYFELFKNFYHRLNDEEALAKVLTQYLSKAVENTVDKDMARVLTDDIRSNVEQVKLKTALLDAVMHKLLEKDNFEEFKLYLTDTNGCFQKWISFFIDEYLFSTNDNSSNRYVHIASKKNKVFNGIYM